MERLHERRTPIDNPRSYQHELEDLQDNILIGHSRRNAAHIFLEFVDGDWETARSAIAAFSNRITSAWDREMQLEQGNLDAPYFGFCLSSGGYRYLRVDDGGFRSAFVRGFERFTQGLRGWKYDFEGEQPHLRAPHALIVAAHRRPEILAEVCGELVDCFRPVARTHVDWGQALGAEIEPVREHFGFVDGISQPRFFERDLIAHRNWSNAAGPRMVLASVEFPGGVRDVGSYFVYLKLQQDVEGFNAAIQQLASELRVDPELAAAWVMGRFRDGTPVVMSDRPNAEVDQNDFNYQSDPTGSRCPLSAHIRKAAPRNTLQTSTALAVETERYRRIARRGLPFTEPMASGGTRKGLLFQSCQADLSDQFEFMLKAWMRSPGFPHGGSGSDRMLGPVSGMGQWPKQWGSSERIAGLMGSFVQPLGGAYFFIPGLQFLRSLPELPVST